MHYQGAHVSIRLRASKYWAVVGLVSLAWVSFLNAEKKDDRQVALEERIAKVADAADTDDGVTIEIKFFEVAGAANGVTAPKTRVLDPDQVFELTERIKKDKDTTMVSYPRVLTHNRRPASIRSVVNEPVGVSVNPETQEEEVEAVPVGTMIDVAPVILESGLIHCEFNFSLSSIVGRRVVEGQSVPVISNRVYSAPLVVKAGHTVCIEGLEAAPGTEDERRLLVLLTPTRIAGEVFLEEGK